MSTRMRHAAHLHCFCHFLCLTEYEIVVNLFSCLKAELLENDSTDCGTENPARIAKKSPDSSVNLKKKTPARKSPADQRSNVLKNFARKNI